MKNYIKGFGIIVALLYSMNALAAGTIKVNGVTVETTATRLDNDGNAASASIDVGSGKCTLTITPGYGKYITVNDISAIKTIDGSNAQTRTPGIDTPVTISATDDTADPSGTTSYTFAVPTTNEYDYEVTATFQSRTSVDNATVEVVGGPYTYSGSAIKPDLKVTVGGVTLTKDTDYKAYYKDSINAGTNTGKVIIEGIRKYNGSRGDWDNPAATYTIEKAEITPVVTITGWTYGSPANAPEVKEGNPGKGEVSYKYKVTSEGDDTYSAEVPTAANNYTVKATVAETPNYKEGTAIKTFTISPKTIAGATITLTPESFTYNGQNQKPTVSVKDGETDLTLDTDYTVSNEGGTNVGEYTVTITGKGNYDTQTTATKKFNITVLEKNPTVALANPDEAIVYDGNAKEPAVTVSVVIKDGDEPTVLTLNTDYTVAYSDNVNAGTNTAKATVTLKGNYKGTGSCNFSITPKSIANVTIADIADQAYTGSAIEPTVTVKDGENTLEKDKDYTISYSNNTAAAASTAENAPTVIVTGKGNYDPNTTATKKFTITPKSIANATITLDHESFVYNGQNQKPTVSVKDGEKDLVLDTDYTITNDGGTNVGEYTITITGKGNYSGGVNKKYNITAATMEVTAEGYTGTYDGKAYGITVTAPEGATIKYGTVEGTYDLTASPTYTNAGTYTVYYSVSKTNYADVTGSKSVVINAKSIANVTITLSPESFTFNGENQKPTTVTVKDGETNLVLDTDYTLTNEGGTNVGEYSVTVTGKGNYSGTASKEYSITANTMEVTAEGYTGTYDGKAHGITVTAPEGATIKYGTAEGTYDLTTNPSYTNVGTYTVYYQVSMENYADVTGSKNVVINKATVTLSYSATTAEGKMGEAFTAPTLNNPSQVAIAYSSSNTQVATIGTDGVVTLTGAGKTTITAAFAGNDNYEDASASYELTVGKQQEAGLSWTDEGMEYYIGDYWYGPRLNNPNKLKVKYESSDEDVATIDENGVVTVLGVGDTWIMAIFEGSDEYEPQTVRYGLFVKERYNLWVDGKQVTSDNSRDILGDGQFFYDEDKKMLVVTNSTKAVDIENRKGDLTIFLNGNSKLGRIFFNKGETDNSGKLTITTYENIPGATTLETSDANGVISGFSSMTIDEESYTFLLDPTKGQYQGGKLVTAEGAVAQTAIIGQYIKPLVNGQTVTFPPGDFDIENLTNAVIKDLLMTLLMDLGTSQVETDDDYYDASENCIVLNNLNSTSGVAVVVDNVQKGQYIPGSSDFAAAFKGGITFMVPNGEGKIILNVQTEPGYKLMLMIGNGTPTEIVKNERGDVEVDYNVEKPTYCYIYLDQTAGTRGTRIGKREKSHGKVFSLKVSPAKSLSTNPLGGVPGFPDSKTPEVDTFGEDDPTGINEVKVETDNTLESNDDNWYDLQGRRIDKPTKAGIYIQNRKKVVIR